MNIFKSKMGAEKGYVRCSVCDIAYPLLFADIGKNCNAWGYGKNNTEYLQCGYGSRFDMDIYKFLLPEPLPAGTTADNICDKCIAEMVDYGGLIKVGEVL